jgi:sugar diacid utilization regulator
LLEPDLYDLAVARGAGRRQTLSLAHALEAEDGVLVRMRDELAVAVMPVAADVRAVVCAVQAREGGRWGVAATPRPPDELHVSLGEACRALRIAGVLEDRAAIGDAAELAPYLLLAGLGGDPDAGRATAAIVQPLVDYDLATGRNLLQTLEVYLDERANASAAARRLHLNRHSLLYRLRKIEQLTGRSIDAASERFVLELSLRMHRLEPARTPGRPAGDRRSSPLAAPVR